MSSSQIAAAAEKDMKSIKAAGFDGVRLNYHFQDNNSVANEFATKAAKQGLYPIGTLGSDQATPVGHAFTPAEMKKWLDPALVGATHGQIPALMPHGDAQWLAMRATSFPPLF